MPTTSTHGTAESDSTGVASSTAISRATVISPEELARAKAIEPFGRAYGLIGKQAGGKEDVQLAGVVVFVISTTARWPCECRTGRGWIVQVSFV